jgi:hypothetical protein
MNDKIKIIEHFYMEALKHRTNSEEFLDKAKHITTFYRESFGINKTWDSYVVATSKNNDSDTIELLSKMKSELLKLNE